MDNRRDGAEQPNTYARITCVFEGSSMCNEECPDRGRSLVCPETAPPEVRVSVLLPRKLYVELRLEAGETGSTVAELIVAKLQS